MERGPFLLLYMSPRNFAVSLFLHFPTIALASFFRHREELAAAPVPLPSPSLPGPSLSHHVVRTPDRGPDAAIWDLGTRRNFNATILPSSYPEASNSSSMPLPSRYAVENPSALAWNSWGAMRHKWGMRSQEAGSNAGVTRGATGYRYAREEDRHRRQVRGHDVC